METVKLSNGVEMPALGYGVFQVAPENAKRCVLDAISAGYRLIDTAQAYFNEEGVGDAVAECGIDRKDLFITTKVWISNAGEEKAYKSILDSLKKLRTDYIDLCLSIRLMATTMAHGGLWSGLIRKAVCAPLASATSWRESFLTLHCM